MNTERVRLGNSDLEISRIGIGTWAWGDRLIWNYGRGYDEPDLREAFAAALEAGIDFFDTAEVYGKGRSERFLGRFIRESGARAVVASKFMPYPWRLRRRNLRSALKRSLDRLGISKVDLYQVHWPSPPVSIETWMDAMADAVEDGLISTVGVSNFSLSQMRRAHDALARRDVPLVSNQVQFNLLQRRPEKDGLLEACRDLDVTLIAYSPLAMGVLTGKYTPAEPPPGFRGRRYRPNRLIRLLPMVQKLNEIGDAHGGKTPAQVSLNWCICKDTVPIPGAKDGNQAEENIGAVGWRLTEIEIGILDRLSDEVKK
jgi:aryl-alcohol dehydrogenase-like predicted oxidoreductase